MDRTLLAERNVGIGLGKWGSLRDGAGRGSRVEKGGALEGTATIPTPQMSKVVGKWSVYCVIHLACNSFFLEGATASRMHRKSIKSSAWRKSLS